MSCDSMRRLVSPYVDGELVGEDVTAFEEHVAGCRGCRAALADEEAVAAAVRAARPRSPASPELRSRVEALVDAGLRPRRPRWALPALAAGLLLAVTALLTVGRGERPALAPFSEFPGLAADTHLRYLRGQLPLEVVSDRPDEVSRWFAGRVPFHLTLPDYPVGPGEQKFYRLEGGRLVSFRGDYAASVVYRMDGTPVSLLVTSAATAQPQGGTVVMSGPLAFHLESVAGLEIITWTDKGLTYALTSDVAVSGARSCLVCHGSPAERRRIPEFHGRSSGT